MCSSKLLVNFSDNSNKQGLTTCFGDDNKDIELK